MEWVYYIKKILKKYRKKGKNDKNKKIINKTK
jgi:hypothetical protein